MKNEKKWKEVKKYRDMNMEIEKGIGNGTENEGGRLGALPSTTACFYSFMIIFFRSRLRRSLSLEMKLNLK